MRTSLRGKESEFELIATNDGLRVMNDEIGISQTGDPEQFLTELIGRPSTKTVIFHC